MEEERQRDFRVPIISTIFFLSCVTGGILLSLWLLDTDVSQPWFPILAMIFISFPWVFWFLTYLYTCIKPCFRQAANLGNSQRSRPTKPLAAPNQRASSPHNDSPATTPTGGKRQVHFGPAVVMDGDSSGTLDGHHEGGSGGDGDVSVASSKECEMPLTLSVSS